MKRFLHNTIALLLAIFVAAAAHGAEPERAVSAERGIEYFRVVPGNCIVKSEDLCQVRFLFNWKLRRAEEACIYLHAEKTAAYCSAVSLSGEVALDLAVGETTHFTLALKQAPEYSVSRDVKVLTIGRDVRVRRRHLWSFL